MNIIIPILYVIAIISALLLIGVVLLQKSKDNGMVAMGAGVGSELFGAQVGTFLVRTTIVLGSLFLLSVLALSILSSRYIAASSIMNGSSSAPAPVSAPVEPSPF